LIPWYASIHAACFGDLLGGSDKQRALAMRRLGERVIWIGNAGDLRKVAELHGHGIEAVVELADSEPLATLPREMVRLRFPLSDGGDNPEWMLRLAAEAVAAMLKGRVRCLVCCSAGMTRSLCIAAAAIAIAENRGISETLAEVAKGAPADISPGLLAAVRSAVSS